MSPAKASSQQTLKQTMEMFESGVERILDGEEFKRFLEVQSRFKTYSARNALLIMLQRQDATSVAGYRTWQSLGRHVLRGEKGIRILAPVTRKQVDEESGEETRVLTGFRTVHVFCYEQTAGEELAAPPAVEDLGGGDERERTLAGRVYRKLVEFCASEGVEVIEADTGAAYGSYRPGAKAIFINGSLEELDRASTLAHELAHHLLHSRRRGERRVEEIEAEGAAFCLFNHAGLETGRFSFGYVARYAADKQALARAIEGIQNAASTMIDAVGDHESAEPDSGAPQSDSSDIRSAA